MELVNDVQVGVAPLTDVDARSMVRGPTTFPVVLRVASIAEHHPAIVEMDCNPVMVKPQGAVVVDARARVRAPEPHAPLAGRPG